MDDYDIEKCALELILYGLKDMDVFRRHGALLLNSNTRYLGEFLRTISREFTDEFYNLLSRYSLTHHEPERFAFYVLSICLQMSKEIMPGSFNVWLACAFLYDLVVHMGLDCKCSLNMVTAWKCLIIFLKRRRNYLFQDHGLWVRFITYLTRFNEISAVPGYAPFHLFCPNPETREQLVRIVNYCYWIDQELELTQEEKEILAAETILENQQEDVEPLRLCDWCGQTCEIFLIFCLRMHQSANVALHRFAL